MTNDGSRARRELELKIKFVADKGQANQAMNELAASAEKVERAAARANRAMGATGAASGQYAAFSPSGLGNLTGIRPGGGGGVGAITGLDALNKRYGPIGGAAGKPGKFDLGDSLGGGAAGQLAESLATKLGLPTTGVTAGAAGGAAAAAVAYQIAKTTKAAVAASQDRYASEQVRERAVISSVPFGKTYLSYMDTFTGRAAGLREAAEDTRIATAEQEARGQVRAAEYSTRSELAGAREMARQLSGARAQTVSGEGRTTAEGERRYRQEVQLAQLRERGEAADRRAAAAREQMEESTRQIAELDAKRRVNAQQRGRLAREPGEIDARVRQAGNEAALQLGLSSPVLAASAFLSSRTLDVGASFRQQALFRTNELVAEDRALEADRQKATGAWRAAALARAQAEAEAATARGPEELRARAGFMEERAGRLLAGRELLGSSSQDSKEDALYAWREIVAGGIENADPAEIAAARAFFPEPVARLAREAAGRDPYAADFAAIDPERYGRDDPDALLRNAADLRNQAGQGELNIQARQAETAARVIKQTGTIIIDGLKSLIPLIREAMEAEFKAQRNAASGVQ